ISAGTPVIYAATEAAGAISENGGKSWLAFELPGKGARLHAVATSLHHPDTAYVSFDRLEIEGQAWFGVAKTSDRGRTWQLVWRDSNATAPNVQDAWINARFGPGWGGHPLNLGVSPNDPDLCYASD